MCRSLGRILEEVVEADAEDAVIGYLLFRGIRPLPEAALTAIPERRSV